MVTGGWKIRKAQHKKYYPLQEVCIACSQEELADIVSFLSNTLEKAKESDTYGQHQHYRYWKCTNGDNNSTECDIVIVVTE